MTGSFQQKLNWLGKLKPTSGFDFIRFEIVGMKRIPEDKHHSECWAYLQKARFDDDVMWCVQYGGGGKYFKTIAEVQDYTMGRWGLIPDDFDNDFPYDQQEIVKNCGEDREWWRKNLSRLLKQD